MAIPTAPVFHAEGAALDADAHARSDDPAVLERLMVEHRTTVIRYAMRLCVSPADAEDAAQEALLALSRYFRSLRSVAALSTWLFTAVRTHCVRLARRSARHVLDPDGEVADPARSPEDEVVDAQLRVRLSMIIADLEPGHREVLIRRDVLEQPAAEVAAAMGIGVDAAKSRLHRARAEVKSTLLRSLAEPTPVRKARVA